MPTGLLLRRVFFCFCLFFKVLGEIIKKQGMAAARRQKTVRKALTRGRGSPYKTASREALGVALALALMFFDIVVFWKGYAGGGLLRFGVVWVFVLCILSLLERDVRDELLFFPGISFGILGDLT